MIAHVSKTLNRPSVRMTGLSWYVFVFKWLNYIYYRGDGIDKTKKNLHGHYQCNLAVYRYSIHMIYDQLPSRAVTVSTATVYG